MSFIEQEDLNRSLFSLVKNNDGYWKSLGQYKFLTNLSGMHEASSSKDRTIFGNIGVQHDGRFLMAEGIINFTPSDYAHAGRGRKAWAHIFFFDGKGIFSQYKIKYSGNLADGTTPESAKLIWERPERDAEDFGSQAEQQAQDRQQEAEERVAACPAMVEGRQVLKGKILSTKESYTQYGISLKMLVQLEDGNRIFGSVPRTINNGQDLKGKVVSFTGNIQPKEQGFSFFSRPTKATINV